MFRRFNNMKYRHQMLFAVIIGFAVVAFWRGAWGIMDVYIFPNDYEISSWISLLIGVVLLFASHSITKALSSG